MRIAVIGTGGVGGYFGGRLALSGHDVTFLARGEHLKMVLQSKALMGILKLRMFEQLAILQN